MNTNFQILASVAISLLSLGLFPTAQCQAEDKPADPVALIKPILDSVLPNQQQILIVAWAIVGLYLLKGIGSYLSTYLMAGVITVLDDQKASITAAKVVMPAAP